jgi:SAM-dependent methyltransferase
MERRDKVKWIYTSKDDAELAERYDRWASDYDADLDEEFGWIGPTRAADLFSRLVPRDAKVLDAGAGTGLVGQALALRGYTKLVAGDLSAGMLNEARTKGVYSEFHQIVLGQDLVFETDSFDAVISVGVLTVGHAPASSLDELVRVTRPGGHIVFTLRPDVHVTAGFKEKQESLENAGKWDLAEVSDEFQPMPKGEPEVSHRIWAYRVS